MEGMMAASMTSTTAKELARLGCSLDLDASSFTSNSMKDIARLMGPGATLKVSNSNAYTSTTLLELARLLGPRITLG